MTRTTYQRRKLRRLKQRLQNHGNRAGRMEALRELSRMRSRTPAERAEAMRELRRMEGGGR